MGVGCLVVALVVGAGVVPLEEALLIIGSVDLVVALVVGADGVNFMVVSGPLLATAQKVPLVVEEPL